VSSPMPPTRCPRPGLLRSPRCARCWSAPTSPSSRCRRSFPAISSSCDSPPTPRSQIRPTRSSACAPRSCTSSSSARSTGEGTVLRGAAGRAVRRVHAVLPRAARTPSQRARRRHASPACMARAPCTTMRVLILLLAMLTACGSNPPSPPPPPVPFTSPSTKPRSRIFEAAQRIAASYRLDQAISIPNVRPRRISLRSRTSITSRTTLRAGTRRHGHLPTGPRRHTSRGSRGARDRTARGGTPRVGPGRPRASPRRAVAKKLAPDRHRSRRLRRQRGQAVDRAIRVVGTDPRVGGDQAARTARSPRAQARAHRSSSAASSRDARESAATFRAPGRVGDATRRSSVATRAPGPAGPGRRGRVRAGRGPPLRSPGLRCTAAGAHK
jgi:hypothetical protein